MSNPEEEIQASLERALRSICEHVTVISHVRTDDETQRLLPALREAPRCEPTPDAAEMARDKQPRPEFTPAEAGAMMPPEPATEPPVSNFKEALPQALATSAKNLLLLAYGMTLGFPTILIPSLQRGLEPGLELTSEQISWLGSINLVCVPLGCLGSGILTTKLGRKRAMMVVNAPLMIAWVIMHLAESPLPLYCALALTGLTGGLLEAPVLTYVAEITTPLMRGILSSTSSMCVILGINSQFILGKVLPWRSVALCNLVAPTLAFLALLLVPESPYWLASKKRLAEARRSLAWLRGWVSEAAVEREFQELVATVEAPQNGSDNTSTTGEAKTFLYRLRHSLRPYKRATFVKPFLLVSGAFFFGHFSGMTTLQTYAVSIFEELGAPLDPYLATVILGLVELGGTLLCVVAVHWTGKRPLTLISTAGAAVCFGVVAGYAQLREANAVPNATWLPLLMLVASAFLTHMGIRLLPWILIGEVFPSEVRGMASGLASSVGYIFGFLANKTHFSLVNALTLPGTFWVYVMVSAVATLVLHLSMPETEGRTLLEINMHFAGRKQPGWKKRQPSAADIESANNNAPKENVNMTDVRNNNSAAVARWSADNPTLDTVRL